MGATSVMHAVVRNLFRFLMQARTVTAAAPYGSRSLLHGASMNLAAPHATPIERHQRRQQGTLNTALATADAIRGTFLAAA